MLEPSPFETSVYANSVVQAFTELGYAEGARATFLYRFAEGGFDQYRKQARGLAAQDCDLLVALRSEPTARALQSVRPAAPILFLAIDYHPLESGVVTNLRSPDRNTTGVYVPQNVLVARRVEILRQLLPQAKRLMVFADPLFRRPGRSGAQGRRRREFSAAAGAVRLAARTSTAPTCRTRAASRPTRS